VSDLKIYLLRSEAADFGETRSAIVLARGPGHARVLLAEAFENRLNAKYDMTGYLATPANPYTCIEIEPAPGVLLAEGQDG